MVTAPSPALSPLVPFSSGRELCFSCSAENMGAQRAQGLGWKPDLLMPLPPTGQRHDLRPQPSPTPAPSVTPSPWSPPAFSVQLLASASSFSLPPLPPLKGDFIPTLLHSSPTGRADRFLNLHIPPKGVLSPRSQPKPTVSVLQTPNSSWLVEALTASTVLPWHFSVYKMLSQILYHLILTKIP